MSFSNSLPQFKGYRIRQQTSTEQLQPPPQTLIEIIVKNQTNGIPKIRHDVICNGKHYPFIPLFSFTSEEDLGILQQISTIVLRDQNQILCEILSKRVTQIPVSQFQDLKTRFQSIFALQLKVDPEELFLILVSEQVNDEAEFNALFDSISETQFVKLMKRVYENCPNKLIPKILRRITKYLNSTKIRSENSVLKFKKLLKIMKSTEQSIDSLQQIESPKKVQEPPKKVQSKVQEKPTQSSKEQPQKRKIEEVKKQQLSQKKVQQKKVAVQEKILPQKPILTISKQEVQAAKKQSQAKRKEKKAKKNEERISVQKSVQTPQQNSSDWHDVNSNDEDQDITNSINKMAFHADEQDEDFKYQGPKKKSKKKNNPATIQLDPEFDASAGRKNQKLQKQNKNKKQSSPSTVTDNTKDVYQKGATNSQQNIEDKIVVEKLSEDKKNKKRQNNKRNGSENKYPENGLKQFTRQKKIDPRILFGINGAPDAVWRQRMRPQRYPKSVDGSQLRSKENRNSRVIKATPMQEKTPKQEKPREVKQSKNLTLQKVFSIPDDSKEAKQFKFQKKNYNLFINKLFWVNIHQGQVTIQKDGKGYIRKCPIEIIDNGKGIMAEGLTINIDGLSNLQDGGTAFGDPVFEEFTPQGQWFLITSLDVFAYV